MSAESVADVLTKMFEQEAVNDEVAAGRFDDFPGVELTDHERKLLRRASQRLPDGHKDKVLVAHMPTDLDVAPTHADVPAEAGYWPPEAATAVEYARDGITDPSMQASFAAQLASFT